MNVPYNDPKNNLQLRKLSDVSVAQSSAGQLLTYSGSNWVDNNPVNVLCDDYNLKVDTPTGLNVKIGNFSGVPTDPKLGVSIGSYASDILPQTSYVSIGYYAGNSNKGCNSTCIGFSALAFKEGTTNSNNTALGAQTSVFNAGNNTTAIGAFAGNLAQHTDTLIINATGANLNSDATARTYIKPVRQLNKGGGRQNALYYDPTTGEITYSGN
jgi:hypothetical protein